MICFYPLAKVVALVFIDPAQYIVRVGTYCEAIAGLILYTKIDVVITVGILVVSKSDYKLPTFIKLPFDLKRNMP